MHRMPGNRNSSDKINFKNTRFITLQSPVNHTKYPQSGNSDFVIFCECDKLFCECDKLRYVCIL